MAKTHGLGSLIDSRSPMQKWRAKKNESEGNTPDDKVCRICGETWTPRTPIARGRRDICYRPECELERERERGERRKAARMKKRKEKKR